MSPKPSHPPRPTDAELEILTVLWSRGPSTVRAVHEAIVRRKPTQYTTVLKVLQIMAEKGLVRRDEKQRAHIYSAGRRNGPSSSLPATCCNALSAAPPKASCWALSPPAARRVRSSPSSASSSKTTKRGRYECTRSVGSHACRPSRRLGAGSFPLGRRRAGRSSGRGVVPAPSVVGTRALCRGLPRVVRHARGLRRHAPGFAAQPPCRNRASAHPGKTVFRFALAPTCAPARRPDLPRYPPLARALLVPRGCVLLYARPGRLVFRPRPAAPRHLCPVARLAAPPYPALRPHAPLAARAPARILPHRRAGPGRLPAPRYPHAARLPGQSSGRTDRVHPHPRDGAHPPPRLSGQPAPGLCRRPLVLPSGRLVGVAGGARGTRELL